MQAFPLSLCWKHSRMVVPHHGMLIKEFQDEPSTKALVLDLQVPDLLLYEYSWERTEFTGSPYNKPEEADEDGNLLIPHSAGRGTSINTCHASNQHCK